MRAPDQQRRHGAAEVRQMKHRGGVQGAETLEGEESRGQPAECRGQQVRMAEHDTLGKPGGAAGVPDTSERVAAASRILHRRRGRRQLFERQHAGRGRGLARVHHRLHTGAALADRGNGRREGVVDDEDPAAAVLQRERHLGRGPPDVDRGDHCVGPRHGEVVLAEAVRVQTQVGHPVPRTDPHAAQPARQPRHAVGQFGEGPGPLPADGGDAIRLLLHRAVQTLGQVHRASVTASTQPVSARPAQPPDAGVGKRPFLRPASTRPEADRRDPFMCPAGIPLHGL